MADTPPPGQLAYEAYWAILPPSVWEPWRALTPAEQARWEAVAQAVLVAALAERVWARQAPSSRWLVVSPPKEEQSA